MAGCHRKILFLVTQPRKFLVCLSGSRHHSQDLVDLASRQAECNHVCHVDRRTNVHCVQTPSKDQLGAKNTQNMHYTENHPLCLFLHLRKRFFQLYLYAKYLEKKLICHKLKCQLFIGVSS